MTTLTEHLAKHRIDSSCWWKAEAAGFRAWCDCGWHSDQLIPDDEIGPFESPTGLNLHDTHVADTWREHRTMRTTEELDALPRGTTVHDRANWTWFRKYRETTGWVSAAGGTDSAYGLGYVDLPAIVLYRPDEDGAA